MGERKRKVATSLALVLCNFEKYVHSGNKHQVYLDIGQHCCRLGGIVDKYFVHSTVRDTKSLRSVLITPGR